MEKKSVRQFLIDLYIEYWNDYLTIETMADHKGLKDDDMKRLIDLGRSLYDKTYKI